MRLFQNKSIKAERVRLAGKRMPLCDKEVFYDKSNKAGGDKDLRKGYQADIVIVKPHSPWTVTKDVIQSKCKWSPMEGHEYQWQVEQTFCNGHLVYNKGAFDAAYLGEELTYDKR